MNDATGRRQMVRALDLGRDIHVAWVDSYLDKSFWFELDDAHFQTAVACIDRRANSPTRYRLFEGARLPGRPGAILIELGTLEEGIIVSSISRYLDSDAARKWLRPEGIEMMQEALLRLGEPSVGSLG
jgi:hypothetical protein